MKEILAMLLALVMLSSTALALAETEKLPGYYKPPVANEGQYPIPGNKTLTYWMVINSGAANFISSFLKLLLRFFWRFLFYGCRRTCIRFLLLRLISCLPEQRLIRGLGLPGA